MGNQYPKKLLDKVPTMASVDFYWAGTGWQCKHCKFNDDITFGEAKTHYLKNHALMTLEGFA